MAKTTAERMAAFRARQRARGLVQLTLNVPAQDAKLFEAFAKERRQHLHDAETRDLQPMHAQSWFSMVEAGVDHSSKKAKTTHTAPSPEPLRAEGLATALLRQIIAMGWPVGRPLGSESELMDRYGASRQTMRQAVRLLSHHAVVEVRSGVGGGLFVAAPEALNVARATSIFLEYRRIGPAGILFTRRTLEQAALKLATHRLEAVGQQRLLRIIEDEAAMDGNTPPDAFQRFHHLLCELSGDPALQLFGSVALELSGSHSTFSHRPEADRHAVATRVKRLHRDICNAMLAGDGERAARRLDRYFDGMAGWLT